MTVVLGGRAIPDDEARPACRSDGIRHDLTWEARRQQYRQARTPASYPTWQPAPVPERKDDAPRVTVAAGSDPVRPGLLRLYAERQAHARIDHSSVRRAAMGERVLVGDTAGADGPIRAMAVIGSTTAIGRGHEEHYRKLHPERAPRYGRLRSGGEIMFARGSIGRVSATITEAMQQVFGSGGSHLYPRIGASKRVMLATFAAILVIASAASTGLASQHRYEVQEGDTIESIAETFGVDPDAIRSSSYLPNGDSLSAGMVIIIPEPGQGATDAAQMAAANEGTSPWVATAHVVEWGENPASIAADYGVGVNELIEFNGIEDPLDLVVGTRVLIPDTGTSTSGGSSTDVPGEKVWVPEYKQQRNLSCEYAATHAAAMAFGWAPTEQDFIAAVPIALNPHYGYRGNIDGWWGNTKDYGIYAEPLVPVLNEWGFQGEVMYTFGDVDPLIAHLDAGHPVVTWLGFWGDTRERLTDDGSYSVFAGMHVVTVYGYDDDGVWVMDPAKGAKVHYSWDFFVNLWSVVDGMSLAIYPS